MAPLLIRGKTPVQLFDTAIWRIKTGYRRMSVAILEALTTRREAIWLNRLEPTEYGQSSTQVADLLRSQPAEARIALFHEADGVLSGWAELQEFGRRRIDLSSAESTSAADRYTYRMLCRLEFLQPLARASLIADNKEKYLSAVEKFLIEWGRVKGSSNRWDSVDESIRILILIETLALIGQNLNEAAHHAALGSLSSAGWTIQANLTRTGNHRIYEGLALFCLGTCLPGHFRATQWRVLGRRILDSGIRNQVLDDGMNAELSTNYHLITGTNFLKAWILGERTRQAFSDEFTRKLARMAVQASRLKACDSGSFALGDSDRMAGSSREEREGRAFAELGGLIRRGNNLRDRSVELEFLLDGGDADELFERNGNSAGGFESCGGYHFVKRADGGKLLFDAGLFGLPGASHHGHADSLSFELHLPGCRFLVDPGGFSYVDREERAFARSTLAHNTVVIDKRDSSDVSGSFNFGRGAKVRLIERKELPEGTVITAEHDGYARLKSPVIHRRALFLMTESPLFLLVADRIVGSGQHRIEATFHGDAGWETRSVDQGRIVWQRDHHRIEQVVFTEDPVDLKIRKGEIEPMWQGWVCHANGQYIPSTVISETLMKEVPVDIVNVFCDVGGPVSSLSVDFSNKLLRIGDKLKVYWKWMDDRFVVDIQ